jgi:hypothetical protein
VVEGRVNIEDVEKKLDEEEGVEEMNEESFVDCVDDVENKGGVGMIE